MTIRELFSDIKILSCEVLGLSKEEFLLNEDKELSPEELSELREVIDERLSHKPVAYILAHKDFYNYTFSTPEGVLIPQPDSEILVEEGLRFLYSRFLTNSPNVQILDLCSGTGCIGISIAKSFLESHLASKELENEVKNLNLNLYLSDISEKAYECFSFNAEQLLYGLNVNVFRICDDLFKGVKTHKFELITANAPYVKSSVLKDLPNEVLKQPHLALDGGDDGLVLIRKIVSESVSFLTNNGMLACEIGYDQAEDVYKLFLENNFTDIRVIKDYNGNDRVVSGICTRK